jgi:hypothetical protein
LVQRQRLDNPGLNLDCHTEPDTDISDDIRVFHGGKVGQLLAARVCAVIELLLVDSSCWV